MKKKKKQMIVVNVSEVKTRSGWNGVKPYTRVQTCLLYTSPSPRDRG